MASVRLAEDVYGPFSGQVTSAARQALRRAVLEADPRLAEALFLCEVSCTTTHSGLYNGSGWLRCTLRGRCVALWAALGSQSRVLWATAMGSCAASRSRAPRCDVRRSQQQQALLQPRLRSNPHASPAATRHSPPPIPCYKTVPTPNPHYTHPHRPAPGIHILGGAVGGVCGAGAAACSHLARGDARRV